MHADDYACLRRVMRIWRDLYVFRGIYELLSGFMRVSKILCVIRRVSRKDLSIHRKAPVLVATRTGAFLFLLQFFFFL